MNTVFDVVAFWLLGIVLGCMFAYAALGGFY
jgi:hypothetical protein